MSSKVSFGDAAQIYFIHLNNHQDYPKIGAICAHLLGPISVSAMRIVDAFKCILDGGKDIFGKIGWGALLVPINFGLQLFNRNKINCSFSFVRGCKSIGKALIYLGTIPQDLLLNLIDPSWRIEHHQFWQELNADIKKDPLKKRNLLTKIRHSGNRLNLNPNRILKVSLQPSCSESIEVILKTSPLYKIKVKSMQESIVEALSEILLRLGQEKNGAIMLDRWTNIANDVINRYPQHTPILKKKCPSDFLWTSSLGEKAVLMKSLHNIYEREKSLLSPPLLTPMHE
ncbi:MAG: hypothetical protein ACHQUC_03655 [Chlamydiales bacterium]